MKLYNRTLFNLDYTIYLFINTYVDQRLVSGFHITYEYTYITYYYVIYVMLFIYYTYIIYVMLVTTRDMYVHI